MGQHPLDRRRIPDHRQDTTPPATITPQYSILNPDYTPNEATASRLGWKLLDPGHRDVEPAQQQPAPTQEDGTSTRR